jgi:hypothetical protein
MNLQNSASATDFSTLEPGQLLSKRRPASCVHGNSKSAEKVYKNDRNAERPRVLAQLRLFANLSMPPRGPMFRNFFLDLQEEWLPHSCSSSGQRMSIWRQAHLFPNALPACCAGASSHNLLILLNLAIYLTPPAPSGCGLTSFANGTGSI